MPNASEPKSTPRLLGRVLLAPAGLALLAYPWAAPNSYLRYAGVLVIMYAVLSTSWNLVGGFTGYISLGHATFFGLGAYATGLGVVDLGLPHGVSLPASAAGVALFALVVGMAAVRIRGSSFVIVTIALVSMVNLLAQSARGLTGGSSGLRVPAPIEGLSRTGNHLLFYHLFLGLLVVVLVVWWLIDRSRFGAGLKAIREDEDKAAALGVPTSAYKTAVFTLSAFFTAVAGGLYGMWFGSLDPIFLFSVIVGANMVLMALLGGVRHLFGPLLGALIVAPAGEYFLIAAGESQLHIFLSGALLAVVVLFLPDGIIPALHRLRRRFAPAAVSIRETARTGEVTR